MTAAYLLPLDCPDCAGRTRPLAEGKPVAKTEVSATCECEACRAEFVVVAHLRRQPSSKAATVRSRRRGW